jgi:hypothetical protein
MVSVKSFDGKEVNWTADLFDVWASVQIPEGSHTFVLDYNKAVPGGMHHQEDISVKYDNFIAGHAYRMLALEGAEARGFAGMFTDIVGTLRDTVNQSLIIRITDLTK